LDQPPPSQKLESRKISFPDAPLFLVDIRFLFAYYSNLRMFLRENRTMLTVTVKDSNDGVVLQCRGRIVRGHETAILCAAVGQQGRNVTLDLSGVDAIDAAGIGSLVSLQASGIYLKLLNPAAPVREALRVTQVDSILEILEFQPIEEPTEAVTAI
jgi:anti-anti-sigma regulatory factor